MTYKSVISQPGSAARNLDPVLGALTPLIDDGARRVLELASYPYEHILGYAERWPDVRFSGTVRDKEEMANMADKTSTLPANVDAPIQLDVAIREDWNNVNPSTPFDGVVMLNLIHCTPEGVPEHIFERLSPTSEAGRKLLAPGGWIAAYGAYLNDDGTFRSPGDEKFDREYIKGVHPSLGLRTPASITAMANKWGFEEVKRDDMPKGNLFIVWRANKKTSSASM